MKEFFVARFLKHPVDGYLVNKDSEWMFSTINIKEAYRFESVEEIYKIIRSRCPSMRFEDCLIYRGKKFDKEHKFWIFGYTNGNETYYYVHKEGDKYFINQKNAKEDLKSKAVRFAWPSEMYKEMAWFFNSCNDGQGQPRSSSVYEDKDYIIHMETVSSSEDVYKWKLVV